MTVARKVLSRFNSLVLARVNDHRDVEELKKESEVPVINALSDLHHPLQTLADLMTVKVPISLRLSKTSLVADPTLYAVDVDADREIARYVEAPAQNTSALIGLS